MISATVELDLRRLEELGKSVQAKAARIAINKAAAVMKAEVVARAPTKYGFLKQSIRIKVKNYRAKKVWVAVIGPGKNFSRARPGSKAEFVSESLLGKFGRVLSGKKRKKVKPKVKPGKYAWLVERGTQHSRAKPFLEPSLHAKLAAFREAFGDALRVQIKELSR